jgi:nitrate/nitrite transporter NarK
LVSSRSFVLSVLGRFFFGVGAESYQAVTIEILTFWNIEFVSFSLAVQSAAEGLGSGLNDFMLPQLYSITGNLSADFWIGFVFAVLCLFSSFTFGFIESYTASRRPQPQDTEKIKLSGIFNFPSLFWLLTLHVCFFDTNASSFSAISGGMSQTRFGFDVEESGILIVIAI